MTRAQLDLIDEALMVMVRDKYAMPGNFIQFDAKYQRIKETHEAVEATRQQLVERRLDVTE